jgi:predicted DNA-binding transcriptional regulator
MANDRAVGSAIFGGSIIGIIVYGLLIYYWPLLILEITAFVAVLLLLAILAWIGYTMATTPPPEPITDIPEMAPEKPPAGSPPPSAPATPPAPPAAEKKP